MSLTEVIRPNGAGSSTQLTPWPSGPNYQCVDDETDSASVYSSSTSYLRDLYALGTLALASDDVIEKITVSARLSSASDCGRGKITIKSGATVSQGDEIIFSAEATYDQDWATDPATGAAWTRAAINVLEMGYDLKTTNPAISSASASWIKVTVSYHHATAPCANVLTEVLRPDGAGDKTQLVAYGSTYNWQCVDTETDPGDYNYTTDSAKRDLYAVANSAIPANARIHKIEVAALLVGDGKLLIKSGGTEYEGEFVSIGDIPTQFSYVWATNPATGVAWTKATIDALQIGVELTKVTDEAATVNWIKVTIYYCVPSGNRGAQLIGLV